ncbi:MAG: TonB-dependent vitamin B12 receptor [Gammaproteobacteria bacterium]|nr:TonB-dependent vitamin B12 receptor [Gammaproteobacteria bacterium]
MRKLKDTPYRNYHRWQLSGALLALTLVPDYASAIEQLDTMNVTATRTARTADETLASVTVITRQDIEKSQAQEVVQLLDALPGISLDNYGGYGKTTSLHLRGTNANQVLVLIDGVRIGSASLGETAWQHLPVSQVERVEVVRGPLSHLYGSDAIGGVIQIFTRKGAQGLRVDGEAGYGTYETFRGDLGLSGGNDTTDFSVRIAYMDTEGFDAMVNNNPDKDGYRNTSLSGSLHHRFQNGLKLQLTALRAEGNNRYDDQWNPIGDYDEDFVQQTLTGRALYSPTDWWDTSVSVGESRDESEGYVDNRHNYTFKTRRPQASWQNDFTVGEDNILTAGLDYLRDELDSDITYDEDSRHIYGVFGQYQASIGSSDFNIGLRYDDNEAYGGHTTGNIAWGYNVDETLRLVASYGTAFRAPTFNELYYPSSGNPDLDPEKSESLEMGVEGARKWGNWSVRAYRTQIDNLISWAPIAPGSWIWKPQNVNSAEIEGLEAALTARVLGWQMTGSVTLLDPRDERTGNLLPGRSKRFLRLDADRRFASTGVGATFRAHSYRYDDPANNIRLPGYGLLDLRLVQPLAKGWSIKAQIKNLFDKEYQTRSRYNEPGRELFVSVVYRPE